MAKDSPAHSSRQTDAPQPGRESQAGATYFVTLVIQERQPWLAIPRTRDVLLAALRAWHAEQNGAILAATAMPDHAHILVRLGGLLTIGQLVERWKSTIRRGAGYAETFQSDFHEHRLRENEDMEDYALYMFLNPYRARLVKVNEPWPGWWAPRTDLFRFPLLLNAHGGPPDEWLGWPDGKFAHVQHGE